MSFLTTWSREETAIEEIERGFCCAADPETYWYVRVWPQEYAIRCVCGIDRLVYPDNDGIATYEHLSNGCGWVVKVKLKGFERLFETKKERRARINDDI